MKPIQKALKSIKKMEPLSVFSTHSKREGAQRGHQPASGSPSAQWIHCIRCLFVLLQCEKINLFTNSNVHECMLDFTVCTVRLCLCEHARLCLGVRSEDVTLWSFITSVTHSPLRSGTQRQCFIKE